MAVRRSEAPKPPVVAVDLDFHEGEEVEIMDLASSSWRRGRVTAVLEATGALPKGSLSVQLGHTTCSIVPEMFGKLVRKLHWTPDAEELPKGGEVLKVASDGSQLGDVVSQRVSAASLASSQERSPEGPVEDVDTKSEKEERPEELEDSVKVVDTKSDKEGVKVDMKSEKEEDSMSKASSDGTTASGKTPLPLTAPQLASSRPPSPTGSSSSFVRPTVSLRIPELRPQSPAPRPSTPSRSPCGRSPCGTPRKGLATTVEGPPYERAQQRLLVVGPGFGRELNPQQGQLLDAAGFQVA